MFGLLCCPWKCTSLSECTQNAVVFGCFHFLCSTFPVSIFSCFYFSRDRTEVGKCNCLNEFFHITQILIEIAHYFHVINENTVAKWSPCFTVLARSLRTMLLLSNHRSKKRKKKGEKKNGNMSSEIFSFTPYHFLHNNWQSSSVSPYKARALLTIQTPLPISLHLLSQSCSISSSKQNHKLWHPSTVLS